MTETAERAVEHDARIKSHADHLEKLAQQTAHQTGLGRMVTDDDSRREKYWPELSIEEKIERTRQQIKRLDADVQEVHALAIETSLTLRDLSRHLVSHRHQAGDGDKVMLPAGEAVNRTFVDRAAGCSRPDNPPDPNKVYF